MKIIDKPQIQEFCNGEIQDFLLELVEKELKNLPECGQTRRRELCQAILNCNCKVGYRDRIRAAVSQIIRDWGAKATQLSELAKMGFNITKGKNHYKMRWFGSSYYKTISASPSDYRTGNNSVTELVRTFF